MGRHLIPEVADALKAQNLLDTDAEFTTVDQILDGLERTLVLPRPSIRRSMSRGSAASGRPFVRRRAFETSSVMAVSAVRAGAARAGHMFTQALLDHYRQTLVEIRQAGYLNYVGQQLRPYIRAAVNQFSPRRRTMTEAVIEKFRSRRARPTRPSRL
jgi:hypothetical protein